jgi:maleylpyruvate isomerase
VSEPADAFAGVDAAWVRCDRSLGRLTEEGARRHSLLPGWSRAHVVAHLWGNAEGFAGAAEGAAAGEVGVMYPGGSEGRARDIEGRAALPLDLITDGARHAHARLVEVWSDMPDDAWDRPIRVTAGVVPVRQTVTTRWREIVVHHVDLDVGFGPDDLSPDYVARDRDWLADNRSWFR